jgi:hypothetical protein
MNLVLFCIFLKKTDPEPKIIFGEKQKKPKSLRTSACQINNVQKLANIGIEYNLLINQLRNDDCNLEQTFIK